MTAAETIALLSAALRVVDGLSRQLEIYAAEDQISDEQLAEIRARGQEADERIRKIHETIKVKRGEV